MEPCRTDRFSMGSIVRPIAHMVLDRPVEPAGLSETDPLPPERSKGVAEALRLGSRRVLVTTIADTR
jgi:hypothetical protein